MAARASKHVASKPSGKVVLFSVLQYANPWQLKVPNNLNLGSNGKLYLTRTRERRSAGVKPLPISLKESVEWLRLLHQCSLNFTTGERFGTWLKMIEKTLS